ncbi:MAG: DUF2334 domain-containing protein [Lachnospiraceae bacterium]|nr:DUF2334 domain-containing protein [Lachnospiraceae bacterium]MBO7531512.1 DUF2334 domain-containing protein [Lachnospiraceae bacterium]MBP5253003.1 DUF2334 domain-containing protein [Lachnospiraceae bacterium]MBP5472333.1 DUF2334 domain-containing protein [Lachnospiraceae bacterium]MBP5701882.1 DUF2334 domain-containing protein [Lachnospiraceae bacterium]
MARKVDYPILVRLEDICPTLDRKKFEIFRQFFDETGIKPLLCVIPENRDPKLVKDNVNRDFWNFVRELKAEGYGIAMHGTYHLATGKSIGLISGDVSTEYAGMSYDSQLKKLREGKHILAQQDLDTEIFAAPNHSYDLNTIRACKKLGINYFSDGMSRKPYMIEGVKFIPVSPFWKHHKKGVLTMCISTNNENLDGRETIFEFLRENLYHVITPEEACRLKPTFYHIARISERMNIRKYNAIRNRARRRNTEQ